MPSDWPNLFVFVPAPQTLVSCPGMAANPSHLSSLFGSLGRVASVTCSDHSRDPPEVCPWNDLERSQDIRDGLLGHLSVLVGSSDINNVSYCPYERSEGTRKGPRDIISILFNIVLGLYTGQGSLRTRKIAGFHEDSDLLVFGCRTVLFKLDAVSATAICISRAHFRVLRPPTASRSAGGPDTHVMAILSLHLLPPKHPRRWAQDHVHSAVQVEGCDCDGGEEARPAHAELLPRGEVLYAASCSLVHLGEPDGVWEEEANTYVGRDLETMMAKILRDSDLDPVTLLPMIDVNPRERH
ncbi:hypothetical protein B0H17DRAFT_1142575 [Mycena rosella]|uniref:Uncharacterized protein n=1 Tax=Mycena rosella TaxID=1033263 RepID=A0AAD7G7T2_MYCRO|nr:hypothetical protein B0H17DRAFT_1142575 [Mycena rosella]